jgi:hypothetical protein
LPFVKATDDELIPLQIAPGFPPYDHQFKAFITNEFDVWPKKLIDSGIKSNSSVLYYYSFYEKRMKLHNILQKIAKRSCQTGAYLTDRR